MDFILLHNDNSNFEVLREELKNNHARLLENLKIGNRRLNLILLIGIPIIISIIMSIMSKFFIN
ncbi:BDR-repeat family protein (plasmid) [Borrelia hermsii YBT]|uniref:BDR-repeat family protein n=1 Tax=Borrelia hermsii YBT TaxID=1313295 RepID=W5T0R7_BORHE|nr:BDR-repeat family protein [Borrelia hermsii YBT]